MEETTSSSPETKQRPLSNYLLWGAVFALLALLGWGLRNSNQPRPEPGTAAPDFAMEFFNGYEWQSQPVANLSDMQGQIVVLNFWASWCVECRLEAKLLEEASRRYADQGVVFLGIAYADTEPDSLDYLREFGITYPNAPDLRLHIKEDYEITGVPETFIIDRDGTIAQQTIGPVNEGVLLGTLDNLLAATP